MKAIPFGPVRVKSEVELQAFLKSLWTPPKMLRGKGLTLQHITLNLTPIPQKKSKKLKVMMYYLFDYSGICFWG